MTETKTTLTVPQALALNFKALRFLTETLTEIREAIRTIREGYDPEIADETSETLFSEMIERAESDAERVFNFFYLSKVWEDMESAVYDLRKEVSELGDELRNAKWKRDRAAKETNSQESGSESDSDD